MQSSAIFSDCIFLLDFRAVHEQPLKFNCAIFQFAVYCVGRTKSALFPDHYSIYLTSMEVTMMLIMNFITIHSKSKCYILLSNVLIGDSKSNYYLYHVFHLLDNCVMKTKEHSKKKKILTIEQSWKMENWSKVVMVVAFCLLCYR